MELSRHARSPLAVPGLKGLHIGSRAALTELSPVVWSLATAVRSIGGSGSCPPINDRGLASPLGVEPELKPSTLSGRWIER